MSLKDRLGHRNTMMRIGFACLLAGNLVHWFLRPGSRLGQDLVDGVFGLLIGLTIGCLLVSLRLPDRPGPDEGT
jgi:hypothetical protein